MTKGHTSSTKTNIWLTKVHACLELTEARTMRDESIFLPRLSSTDFSSTDLRPGIVFHAGGFN